MPIFTRFGGKIPPTGDISDSRSNKFILVLYFCDTDYLSNVWLLLFTCHSFATSALIYSSKNTHILSHGNCDSSCFRVQRGNKSTNDMNKLQPVGTSECRLHANDGPRRQAKIHFNRARSRLVNCSKPNEEMWPATEQSCLAENRLQIYGYVWGFAKFNITQNEIAQWRPHAKFTLSYHRWVRLKGVFPNHWSIGTCDYFRLLPAVQVKQIFCLVSSTIRNHKTLPIWHSTVGCWPEKVVRKPQESLHWLTG